jgi:hypothetical protein
MHILEQPCNIFISPAIAATGEGKGFWRPNPPGMMASKSAALTVLTSRCFRGDARRPTMALRFSATGFSVMWFTTSWRFYWAPYRRTGAMFVEKIE